jgi:HEAT repeat protein
MKSPNNISLDQVINALLDENKPLSPRYLYRFSDMSAEDLAQLKNNWQKIPLWRRQALMEDIEDLGESDYLLSFEALARFALKDADPKVRLNSVHTLWEYEERDLAIIFLEMLKTENSMEVRAALASALGRFVYLGDIEELDEALLHEIEDYLIGIVQGDDDTLVRRCALESLGYSHRQEVNPLIEQAYNSKEKDWVGSALFAMGHSAGEAWGDSVLKMISSVVPIIRTEAARAAGALELSEAVEPLLEMLKDSDEEARMAAIWSLSQIGGEGVRDSLEELQENVEDEDEIDFIESALDNLAFTEELESFPLFDVIPDDLETDEDDDLVDEVDDIDTLEDEDNLD